MKKYLLFILLICVSQFARGQYFNPTKSDAKSFLKMATEKSKFGWITIVEKFPENWVKEKDLDKLIEVLNYTKKSKCTMDKFSSNIPNGNSELSGFATIFIESFKNKKRIDLGLYSCPTTNLKKKKELIDWWKNYKKTKPAPNRR